MQITPDFVALVTGAASGLGHATTRRILDAGGKVVMLDLPGSSGAEMAEQFNAERAGSVAFCATDVRDADQVAEAVATATQMGSLRLAVNCAGVATPGKILGRKGVLPLETYKTVIDINLIGTFNVIRLAAAAMAENEPDDDGGRGVIVNTASIAAFDGQAGQAAYAASKAGVIQLARVAAKEGAARGVRVNALLPGGTDTGAGADYAEMVATAPTTLWSLTADRHRPGSLAQSVERLGLAARAVREQVDWTQRA